MATIEPKQLIKLVEWWKGLWQPFEIDVLVGNRVLEDLLQAYSQCDRHYHTLNHLEQVLERVWDWKEIDLDFSSLQLAAWFHDVIYHPKASDNEVQSAEYAALTLAELGSPKSQIDRVVSLILCTQSHQASNHDLEAQILLDADLAILGADPPEYKAYARGIRREYSWLSESEYRVGRMQVLDHFLQRDRLFWMDEYYWMFEQKARRNLQDEMLNLN